MSIKEQLKQLVISEQYDDAYNIILRSIKSETQILAEDTEYCIIVATVLLAVHNYSNAFDVITLGLMKEKCNYELYLLLGEYYYQDNLDKALLCFYQALFYCENESDSQIIMSYIDEAIQNGAFVRNVSIVIVTYNSLGNIEKCVESIKRTIPLGLYELIIVDNASDDGTMDFLESLEDDLCISNVSNEGFVRACNYGIKNANPDNDIFILDSSTELIENSFFYLMLGLYDDENIGAISALTNNKCTDQCLAELSDEEYLGWAEKVTVPMNDAYEKKSIISDFAVLIARKAIDQVGLLDEHIYPAYLENADLCIRMLLAGYGIRLCYNSFIFCYEDKNEIYKVDDDIKKEIREYLKAKWGFDIAYSNSVRMDLISMIEQDKDSSFEVLELGCALGNTLNRIEFHWPNSETCGIEFDKDVVRIAERSGNIIQGDVENMVIPYEKETFDYIICGDVLEHLREPEETIKRFMPYLKKDGHFLISLPNIRYFGVSMMLAIAGRFDYQDCGILDRTHLRFFTKDTAIEMLENAGLEVVRMVRNWRHPEQAEDFIKRLGSVYELIDGEELKVFQYFFLARMKSE